MKTEGGAPSLPLARWVFGQIFSLFFSSRRAARRVGRKAALWERGLDGAAGMQAERWWTMRWRGFGAKELLEPHGEGCSRGRGRKWWSLTEARWSAVERGGARGNVTERRQGSAAAAQYFDVCAVAARLWIVGGGE
jgi:hypothetical protein